MTLMQSVLTEPVPPASVALWWLGQSGFFMKLSNGKVLLIDAYLSDSVRKRNPAFARRTPLPLLPGEVVCDYYLCTHNHLDHADPETIAGLTNRESMIFVGPRNVVALLQSVRIPSASIILLEAGDTVQLDGFRLTGSFCIPNEDRVLDSIGFLIQTDDGITVYHTGDTAWHPFLKYLKKHEVDMMLTCINGKYGNLNGMECHELASALAPGVVIPTHYDMFGPNAADPLAFAQLFDKSMHTKCLIPQVGTRIAYPTIPLQA